MIIDAISDGLTLLCWVALVGGILAAFLSAVLAIVRMLINATRPEKGR